MQVKVNDKKTVIIKDNEIKQLMKTLDITEQEAIETWLFDHDYTTNEQVEILTKKAKANKTDKIIATDKTKRAKTERKPIENPLKQAIIQDIYNFLIEKYTNIEINITNKTKLIEFSLQNKQFKLDLIEKRTKKE